MENLKNNIEIIPFNINLKEPIKTLNYEWLEKYFYVEDSDRKVLSNPIEEIIHKGGFIYYVKLNNHIVGTVSLLKKTNHVFEIAKMAVSENAQPAPQMRFCLLAGLMSEFACPRAFLLCCY